MKTEEFIRKHLHATDGRTRICSSVMTDGNGNFFSYGYHYPLVVKLSDNLYAVNDAGYSVTTAKHINWAKSALDNQGVNYNYNYAPLRRDNSKKGIMTAVRNEMKAIENELQTLRKNATRKRSTLENRFNDLLLAKSKLKGI